MQSLHLIKLIVESPSFKISTLNLVYRRNQFLLFADMHARYDQDPYGLMIKYADGAIDQNCIGEVRLKIKDTDYWLITKILSDDIKRLDIEIHLDKNRDIHINIGLLFFEQRKELSFDLKWDANRDPAQRLAFLAEFNNTEDKRYYGNLMITYPDRTINFACDLRSGSLPYFGKVRISWSTTDIIQLLYNLGFIYGEKSWLYMEMITPFKGWQKNHIDIALYTNRNLISANTSLLWANNQNLQLHYRTDYEIVEPNIRFEISFGMNTTVKDMPQINILLRHSQDSKRYNTTFGLDYKGLNDSVSVYKLKSLWDINENSQSQNISGSIFLISPFVGYRRGGLAAKFIKNNQRQIHGAASLNFDMREYTLSVDGHVTKLTDNILIINITTPIEKLRNINARFGLSERRRHAVAEVRSTSTALGVEVLCDVISLMNFDTKFSIATPIENFQEVAVFAKLKPETIDFHGIWNNGSLGFTGVWRMVDLRNFEYSYFVYTPLKGFEENGFIIKFIKTNLLVTEVYGRIFKYKLGVKLNGNRKISLVNQLGSNKIELETLYDEDFRQYMEDYDENDIDYDEYFSYLANFQIDTIVWPTINGILDIQEILDYYIILGNLQLPQGSIDFKDRLYYPDYLNVVNVLNLNTPFQMAKEIKAIIEYHIDLDLNFIYEKIELLVNNDSRESIQGGAIEFNYTKIDDLVKPKQHALQIRIRTPFETLPYINVLGSLEAEDNIYRSNISSSTANSLISLSSSMEVGTF